MPNLPWFNNIVKTKFPSYLGMVTASPSLMMDFLGGEKRCQHVQNATRIHTTWASLEDGSNSVTIWATKIDEHWPCLRSLTPNIVKITEKQKQNNDEKQTLKNFSVFAAAENRKNADAEAKIVLESMPFVCCRRRPSLALPKNESRNNKSDSNKCREESI